METVYEYYTDEKRACVSTDERRVVNHIWALAKEYPDDVQISYHPGSNQGVLVAYIPRSWIRLPKPPRKISDERRARLSEHMKNVHLATKSEAILGEEEEDG